jgi:Na+-driven multidrug efflux pump
VEEGVINKVLSGLPDATDAIASFAVYHRILALALMPAAGASVAVVPYVALALPAGDLPRIRRDLRRTLLAIAGLALVLTAAAGWLFAAPLAEFFVGRRGTLADAAPPTVQALRLLPLAALAAAPFLLLRPVFEAAHRPRLGIELSVVRFVLLSAPLILAGRYLAPALGLEGLTGVILGVIAATALAGLLTARRARAVLAQAA